MAHRKTEAWLTSAVDDGSVASAIVLAESIRKTKTTRTIAVITTRNVATEKRVALRKAFDAVFCMDESYAPNGTSKVPEDIQAKIYAFSLRFFEKCVFVTPDCLVLENADKLFEDKANFSSLRNKDGSMDLSLFMFEPCKGLWEHLWESMSLNGSVISETYLSTWFKNQRSTLKMGLIPDTIIAKFSVARGTLLSDKTHAPIIQYMDIKDKAHFVEEIVSLKSVNMGLHEKLITGKWLDIFNQTASVLLKNPMTAPSIGAWEEGDQHYKNEPIAIVGMSCRYPGANSLEEFWNMLYQGEEGIREPPAFRWTREHSLRVSQQERKTNAGFLSTTVDEFDARFFGVSPKEAAYMDPQARLLHEVLWEALEDSGIDPLSLYGTHTGIFTGSWMNDYKDIVQGSTDKDFFRTYMGNSMGAAAARLSFLLGLTGPSVATESGCSSAIVALDLAVRSLRTGESNLAMAGGVNLLLHPFTSNIMDYVIAPNGRCKTFDSNADGFGRAEGCGVLVLKRLSDALRDRDNIWAMIRGSAVSQEGLSRSLGTPTVHCEALAMQLALQDANVSPEQVSFVETHGTGTAVGDPMESAAITKAYYSANRKLPLIIGSVKTNVGHTESCSGITGIMKTILAMQHEIIPKHRNLESLNPEIFLDSIPAMIPLEPVTWPKVKGHPRIAGVSSFGITGTDGHVIIQESPDYEMPKFSLNFERPTHILKISGKTGDALEELLKEYENLFSEKAEKSGETTDDLVFSDAAFSANVGRATFNHRAFIVAQNYQDAAKLLKDRQFLQAEAKEGENHQICFLFTGQGSQYQGMAKMLYETSPIFRIHFDSCDRTLRELYNLSIRQVLWESDPSSKELSRTIYSQTAIFCVEYCLLKLWQSWGIQPDYVLGHSLGEFCAAVAAGILDFKDALKLVAERSRLIDSLPRGSMLVIKASKPEVDKLVKSSKVDLDFAAVNHPEQTVVAGDTEKIQQFLGYLKNHGVKAIILEATHAFHSRHMDPMLEKYRKIAETISYKQGNGNIQYVSGMEGRIMDDPSNQINADYWVRHTREKVSFIDACKALRLESCQHFLEVGPQPVLSSFVMLNNEDVQLTCLPSLRRGTEDWNTILTTLGKLYLLGYKVDWKGYDEPYTRKKGPLPFHPFHRKSFWVECSGGNVPMIHPLIGCQMNNASTLNIFQNDLTVKSVPYVKDHCIGNRIVYPGAAYTEMCLSAGYCVANGITETLELPRRAMRLENMRIDAPLELKEEKSCRLQVIVDLPESASSGHEQKDNQGFRVKVYHQNTSHEESGKWVLHASSTFIPVASTKDTMKTWNPNRMAEIMSTAESTSSEAFYKRVDETGLRFGENFRMLKRYWCVKQTDAKFDVDEVVAEMEIPSDYNKYLLHPLIIDAVFQTGILTNHRYQEKKLKVPVRVGQLTMYKGIESDKVSSSSEGGFLYLHAWFANDQYYAAISTADSTLIALIEDVELIETNVKTIESVLEQQSSRIPDAWEEMWKVIPSPFATAVEVTNVKSILADPKIQQELRAVRETSAEDVDLYVKTKKLMYLYILNALRELGWNPSVGDVIDAKSLCTKLGILQEYKQLVRYYFTVLNEEAGILVNDKSNDSWKVRSQPPTDEKIQAEIANLGGILKASKVSVTIRTQEYLAQRLSKILTGQLSALGLLFPTDEDKQIYSADVYYQNHPGRQDLVQVTQMNCRSIFQQSYDANINNPGKVYRFLEVGSGTGSGTTVLIELLHESWGDRFEYYYTDVSQSFFAKAEKKFEKFSKNLKFAVFNIEQSPLSQGIPLNYFDVIAATDVLHATRDLDETLIHLHQTLRPGGTMVFTETIIPALDITFVFGLLAGYWRMEDFQNRPHHCCVGEQGWEQALNRCGFQMVNSSKAHVDEFSCIVAVSSPDIKLDSLVINRNKSNAEIRKEWIVLADETSLDVISSVANVLDASGFKVVIALRSEKSTQSAANDLLKKKFTVRTIRADDEDPSAIESIIGDGGVEDKVQGIIYAWGMNVNEAEQTNLSLPLLHIAKTIVSRRKPPQLYVLTKGVHGVSEDILVHNPAPATMFGMVKSLKNENSDMFVRYVDLEQGPDTETIINQVLFELAMNKGTKEYQRVQVAYRGNLRYEPRMVKAAIQSQGEELKLPPSTDRYHLALPKTRLIQDLEFETLEDEKVGDNEVEVKVKAYALNFRDIFAILKPIAQFEQMNTVGLDFAGVVTKVGSSSKLSIGDRVFGANLGEGQLRSHLVLESDCLLQIPDDMTYCEAVTLPAVFSTAYYCLITIAKMKKGDTVLIHTGSGGVGLAAIQLAKHIGVTIITTAGNPRKRAYLRSLGIQHVFHSRNVSFENDILRVTGGKGVDVVLNSITGPGIKEATLNASAKNARFVEMSKLSIWTPEEVKALRPDVIYNIVDLSALKRDAWSKLLDNMKDYLESGNLKPIPYVKFDALNIRQALQYFQKARHIGKVVCAMPDVTTQGGQFSVNVPLFNSESTYLITGGLGAGIGFEVCKWMLGLGATDVVLMGRRSPKPDIAAQIKELNDKGFNVMVRLGDVGNFANCKQIIDEISERMKPLRGIMHCAGVLSDNFFTNQTWDTFNATFLPKVTGTWNLHRLTSKLLLEHFVLYSSVTALVGTPGQPNHAAANCFEDAFIHYRHSLGLPGTTINWGQWAQVGCAKEISLSGILPVSVTRMLNGLEMAIKTHKRQVCFSEFDSFNNFSMLCPIIKSYLDDRLWKQLNSSTQSSNVLKTDEFWKEMDEAETKKEKIDVLSGYLKAILRTALRLEPDEPMSDDANIQELGVDSLMMIELKNSIQSLLGSKVNVTANLIKNCNTVRLISNAIVGELMESENDDDEDSLEPLHPQELLELLSKDVVLEESIKATVQPAVRPSQIKTVLLTGATGQLAPYIISKLSTVYNSVDKIVCLVRGIRDDAATVTQKFKATLTSMNLAASVDMNKMECIPGDVALPNFGLSPEKYTELCESIDGVIHCAAKTNHAEFYRLSENGKLKDIRSVNVGGTINILKFASTSKTKHVYFPSTFICGIFLENEEGTLTDDWPDVDALHSIVNNKMPGVETSKFVCELLLKEANSRGIPCKVFRFPWIAGESTTGRLNYMNNLYILRFLSFLKMKAMPSIPFPANFLPVDMCADLSLGLYFNDLAPFEIFNIGHPQPQVEQEFVQIAKEEFNKDLEILEWKEFAQRLEDSDTNEDSLKDLYNNQRQMSVYMADAVDFVKGYLVSPDTFFANKKVVTHIPGYGQGISKSMDILRRDLQFIKSTGFMEKFGI